MKIVNNIFKVSNDMLEKLKKTAECLTKSGDYKIL
jgi:hypothetical protein